MKRLQTFRGYVSGQTYFEPGTNVPIKFVCAFVGGMGAALRFAYSNGAVIDYHPGETMPTF